VCLYYGCRSGGAPAQVPGLRLRKPGALGHSLLKAQQSGIPERLPQCAISAPAFSFVEGLFLSGLSIPSDLRERAL